MIEIKKTRFEVDGHKELCYEVTDGFTMVRISKCYHYIGNDSLWLQEYVNGKFNSKEEWKGNFDTLTHLQAKALAKEYSVYLR